MASEQSNAILASWHDGATKQAIVDFVARVTTEGGPEYVQPVERIAVFDNDGTLWCEKPIPIQLGFFLERLAMQAEANPELRERQPWKAAYTKDYGWLGDVVTKHYHGDDSLVKVTLAGILKAFEGVTVEQYGGAADAFIRGRESPQFKRPYLQTAYAPMIELLRYLEANGFTNYIASGGDRDFMRPITWDTYGIPSERVIGSTNALTYEWDGSIGQVKYLAQPDVFDDGPVKPVRIWSRIGRRPLIAGGNSNGDIPMLEYAAHPSRPSLSLLLNHDDDTREVAYTAGAEKSLEVAAERGWTVISVKHDWKTVFVGE